MSGFAFSQADVERLVRLVMADLGRTGGAAAASVSNSAPPASGSEGETTELRLTSNVITLKQVGGASSYRRVVVRPGAVVTPSARDELKKQGVELIFDRSVASKGAPLSGGGRITLSSSNVAETSGVSAGTSAPSTEAALSLTVAFHAIAPETVPARFLEGLGKTIPIELYQNKCVMQTASFLAERLEREKAKGILFTRYTAAASAVCNRKSAIRALVAGRIDRLDADAASIGANLLILDPGEGLFQVRRMVSRFVELGAVSCPNVLRKGLGS